MIGELQSELSLLSISYKNNGINSKLQLNTIEHKNPAITEKIVHIK